MSVKPSHGRRASTNEKLSVFLNATEIVDDEADALDLDEIKARNQLRSKVLYGAGARFNVPKTIVMLNYSIILI